MLTIKTKIAASKIDRIGLFADELILKGTKIWEFTPRFDLLYSKEEIDKLPEPARKQLKNYAFFDNKYRKYMLCGDDARFINHSSTPNCDDSNNDTTIALKDIQPGEELTIDYRTFYGDISDHPEITVHKA